MLTSYHSRHCLLSFPVRHRLVLHSLRSAAQALITKPPRTQTSGEPLPDQIHCPWASKGSWEIYLECVCSPAGDHSKPKVTIYTDGSATGGTTAESTAVVATVGDPTDPVIIHTSTARGA